MYRNSTLISIGEAVHASIPATGAVMKELAEKGPAAFTEPSEPLQTMQSLIEDQARAGADYIAVNVDALGEDHPQRAAEQMVHYVRLVRQWGHGVPVCVDSSDNAVLIAGLKEWVQTDQAVRPPLINSIKVYTSDALMPYRREHAFTFVGLLMSEDKPAGPGGSYAVDELVSLAHQLFDQAVNRFGFEPQEIFFDSTVFPLAIDMPMEPGVPGYTYRTFETIKRIKNDSTLKDVHCSLGISNCCRDLPGRKIGICRAYVAKAMEYGLDAGIVNVHHHYGQKTPDPVLLDLVTAYARMDGSIAKTNDAIERMGQFCRALRTPDHC